MQFIILLFVFQIIGKLKLEIIYFTMNPLSFLCFLFEFKKLKLYSYKYKKLNATGCLFKNNYYLNENKYYNIYFKRSKSHCCKKRIYF